MEAPKINCINLPHRIDRRINAVSEFAKQGIINFSFWDGVEDAPSFVGIAKAHKNIVRDAKEKGLPIVCICEDDIEFSDIGAWRYFIDNTPADFDLYLASIYWSEPFEESIVFDFSGLTLYIVHERYYDKFLSTPETANIDRMQSGKGKFVVCNPFAAYQIDGYSDNVKAEVKYYETYLKNKRFYRSVAANNALMAASLNTSSLFPVSDAK